MAKMKALHNHAGKYLGILALTNTLGLPFEIYCELEKSAQRMSLNAMAYMAEVS